jgi:CHAD domain-containing protein
MDYGFRRDETSSAAARRVAKEQLEAAIAELEAMVDVDRHVHSVRKRLKKLRGLLRLLQYELGRDAFRLENRTYRDAGHRLAGPRRAAATLAAFDALMQHYPGALSQESRAALRGRLVAERDRLVEEMHGENHAQEVEAALAASLERLPSWPLERDGWALFARGFERSYARGRRAFRAAEEQPTTENLHEWRKSAKHYWYHVRLLERVWPHAMRALEAALGKLTEELGDDHDLDDLRQVFVSTMPPEELASATARLLAAIDERRQELRSSAFALGRHVYAERPKAAAHRMASYHAAWLAEPEEDDGESGSDE